MAITGVPSTAIDAPSPLSRHHECQVIVAAPVARVFAHLDDHTRMSSHMGERSWKMGGGRMTTELDEGRGQRVGSIIRLSGRVLGVVLSLEEVVVERNPPFRKAWQTIGAPRLLVIGHYRMGFELATQGTGSLLRVFIDYALPDRAPARWLGRLLGRRYAEWCTQRMADDAARHFASAV